MRILVNQTTRMGDVLQTGPLFDALRALHPDAHITALVRAMGETPARRHPAVDEVLVYGEDDLYLDLKSGDADRYLRAYDRVAALVADLRARRFDLACNAANSLTSAMLLGLLDIPETIGGAIGADGQFLLRGAWPRYFFTSVFSRECNDLNLCDIFRHFAPPSARPPTAAQPALAFRIDDADESAADGLLARHGVAPGDFLVCMQLGASETAKRWAEDRFADLARLLRDRWDAKIALVGVREEARLGEAFEAAAPGIAAHLFGGTSLPVLAALLRRARVLVTNDTGTMHVAAAVGCPVALISVGHVHYRETGPYGVGHCAIEPRRARVGAPADDDAERRRVTAAEAMRAVEIAVALREGKHLDPIPDEPALAAVDILHTRFAPDGCLQFYPAIRRAPTDQDALRMAYRAMWLEHLNGRRDEAAETASLRAMMASFDMPGDAARAAWTAEHGAALGELAGQADEGVALADQLLAALRQGAPMRDARALVDNLMRLDDRMRALGERRPGCRPLVLMARFERDTLEGADPHALAETTRGIYAACAARARLAAEKLAAVAAWRG